MREFIVRVNGEEFKVEVEEVREGRRPAPLATIDTAPVPAGPVEKPKPQVSPSNDNKVVAPMPGTILAIKVKEGDTVKAGDVVVILEAMKLENNLNAPISGTIKSIKTTVGASVNPGDILVQIG